MKLEKYIGKTLYGFCNGVFGRDSYDNKRVVYAGRDYLVAENENRYPVTASFKDWDELEAHEYISRWLEECEEY